MYPVPTGGGGTAPEPFPEPPTGYPDQLTTIARQLRRAADSMDSADTGVRNATSQLQQRWDGTASQAYGAQAGELALIAHGAAETFRQCSQAVSGYGTDLDDCQVALIKLKAQYDAAVRRVDKAGDASKHPDRAIDAANQIVQQADQVLKDFRRKARGHRSVLEGSRPGHPGNPLAPPTIAAGQPGATFGIPGVKWGTTAQPDPIPIGAPLPVGSPTDPSLYGYWFWLDSKGIQPVGDLTTAIVIFAPIGGKLVELAGAKAIDWLTARAGEGGAQDALATLTQSIKNDPGGWSKLFGKSGVDLAGYVLKIPGGSLTQGILKEVIGLAPEGRAYVIGVLKASLARARSLPGAAAKATVQRLTDILRALGS